MATALMERVLVVDDDEAGRDLLMEDLRDFDFEPLMIKGAYGLDIAKMVTDIQVQQPSFVICDHKLQSQGLASFFGADVVQKLNAINIPAMLLTMYESTEQLRLRGQRDQLPVVLGRDNFRIEALSEYYETCFREVNDNPVSARVPHRVVIRVDEVRYDSEVSRLVAVISSWSPDHAVAIPSSCITEEVFKQLQPGMFLLGDVNIGATTEEELFFKNINEIITPKVEI